MTKKEDALKIAHAVGVLWERHSAEITQKRIVAETHWQNITSGKLPHWMWDALIQSFATNGGARHWENVSFLRSAFTTRGHEDPFSWPVVLLYSDKELVDWLGVVANPHFQRWEGNRRWLVEFANEYRDAEKLSRLQDGLAKKDRASCLATLNSIAGISDKYARNLLMDVGHPEFMDNSLALDSRIGKFLWTLTQRKHAYSAKSSEKWTESELVSIAHGLKISAWEMDRLLFWFAKSSVTIL